MNQWSVTKALQFWHDVAIEKELETAIFMAGGMRDSNFGDLNKVKWGRSSRTDKGVGNLLAIPFMNWLSLFLFLHILIFFHFYYDVLVLGAFSGNNNSF